MTPLLYLVLLHIGSGTPVATEGPYAEKLCSNVKSHREAQDDHDDAVLTRHDFGWICMTPELTQTIVKVYHCEVESTVKNKLGATARTYVCIGQ